MSGLRRARRRARGGGGGAREAPRRLLGVGLLVDEGVELVADAAQVLLLDVEREERALEAAQNDLPLLEGELYASSSRLDWRTLLKRTFEVDLRVCVRCGGKLTVRAVLTDPDVIAKMLHALRRTRAPSRCRQTKENGDDNAARSDEQDLELHGYALGTRAVEDKIPGEVVLADCFYGVSSDLQNVIRMYGLDFGVAVNAVTRVWLLDAIGRRRGEPVGAQQLGVDLGPKAFRRITWREGTKGSRKKLSSRFCFRRVKVANDDGTEARDKEPLWLVIEWPEGENKPTKFTLTSLPRRMTKKQIVRLFKERWRTERAYEDLKGELGLDHFEGRSFPGWHHHVSVVLCCYAFIVAERVRHFPPSAGRRDQASPDRVAA